MEKPFRYLCISAGLDKDIQNIAVAIDGLPQPKLLSADRDNNVIEVPFVSWSRPVTPDDCGIYYPEFCNPLSYRFVADDDAPRRE